MCIFAVLKSHGYSGHWILRANPTHTAARASTFYLAVLTMHAKDSTSLKPNSLSPPNEVREGTYYETGFVRVCVRPGSKC